MNIEEQIRVFINELCIKMGICDPLDNLDYFISKEHYEVNNFVRELFLAEGIDPDIQISLFRKVKRRFIEQFGTSEIYNPKS